MRGQYENGVTTLIVFVPPGMAKDARDRIWAALESAPRTRERDFALEQVTAYEGNLGRMFEGT